MARFKAVDQSTVQQKTSGNHPFKNVYGCVEGDMVYVNMEVVDGLQRGMTTQRDMYVVVDMSGSMLGPFGKLFTFIKEPSFFEMSKYKSLGWVTDTVSDGRKYRSWSREALVELEKKGYVSFHKNEVKEMLLTIIDSIAPFDDDGVDVYFFSDDIVHSGCVSNAAEIDRLIKEAIDKPTSFRGTMPISCFKRIGDQIKAKRRPGTVFFLTDGVMDDGGRALRDYYKNVLHTEFKTRDMFYCYSIEYGKEAEGCLDVLDGLFAPEQGPEDLFDVESSDNLEKISNVLKQVGGMSAIGSDEPVDASVTGGNAKIDMVNADLIEGGMTTVSGPLNQVMSFRIRSGQPFALELKVKGYDTMKINVTPGQYDAKIDIV